jgi:hypothetical protein
MFRSVLTTRTLVFGDHGQFIGVIMWGNEPKDTKETYKFTGLYRHRRHGGEITIGGGVFISAHAVSRVEWLPDNP